MAEKTGSLPFVSVVMPVRNEAAFLQESLGAILAQDYPKELLEILIADGMSDDGTRDIVRSLRQKHKNLTLLDNPQRIVSTGLNSAISRAKGEIVIRIDGHAIVAPDFVRQNVNLMVKHTEAWSTGGPIRHVGRSSFGKAVAVAMAHPLGVGNATHRYPDFEGYVEGAQFPAIRRWVFERVGGFDEKLVRNQDDEFNYRITKAGGKILISPRVKYVYYVRETPRQLLRQYVQYGFWRLPVIKKHKRPTTLRQLVPTMFYLCILTALLGGLLLGSLLIAILLPLLYCSILLAAGVGQIRRSGLRIAALFPAAIAIMHAGYAWGFLYGLWAARFNPGAWKTTGSMAKLSR